MCIRDRDEVEHLRAKAVKWADAVRTGHISSKDAWYCLNNTILKTMEYPLMSTCLSQADCTYIMAPILTAGLPLAHLQCYFPRDLVYGTLRHQGVGIPNPHDTQLIQHLQAILHHGTRSTVTGKLL